MIPAHERLVNLALFLASSRRPVSVEDCRAAGLGYPEDADEAAFLRMFERDKEVLRAAGIAIVADEHGLYHVDAEKSFSGTVDLTDEEAATIRAVGAALMSDPGFPFRDDLGLAIAKLDAGPYPDEPVRSEIAEADSAAQSERAAVAADAAMRCKRLRFDYTNASGKTRPHEVEPYGLALRRGRWYLVGRDVEIDEIRVYALMRASGMVVNASSPKTPDFERPETFSVEDHLVLPFQIGPARFLAEARFDPDRAWQAERLSEGRGSFTALPDGSVSWSVDAASARGFAVWCVEHAPGVAPVAPPEAVDAYVEGLRRVVESHG